MEYKRLLTFLLIVSSFFGCRNSSELKDFTYTFSMESAGNFKIEFQLNPDSTYQIVRNNYFFDKYEGKKSPLQIEGRLIENEFNTFKKLIEESGMEKMKDAYGFDSPNPDNTILYVLCLKQENTEKYVSVSANAPEGFQPDFIQLVEYTNAFINAHVNTD